MAQPYTPTLRNARGLRQRAWNANAAGAAVHQELDAVGNKLLVVEAGRHPHAIHDLVGGVQRLMRHHAKNTGRMLILWRNGQPDAMRRVGNVGEAACLSICVDDEILLQFAFIAKLFRHPFTTGFLVSLNDEYNIVGNAVSNLDATCLALFKDEHQARAFWIKCAP